MTDSMKFGPEWLRNMKSDTSALGGGSTPVPTATATIKMAEFRYGREEMLALFDRTILPPDPLKQMQGLYVEKSQLPLALIQMTDEETRMWNRGINSDVAMRLLAKPGPGVGIPGTRGALGGRGGSVDRGRGRARGSYHYSRGLSYEESDTSNGYNNRGMRGYERTQSQGNWGERNGGDPGDYTSTSPRKEFGGRSLSDTNWRRHRGGGEEDDGWRPTRSDKWGRGSSNSWREGDNNWERNRTWDENTNSSHPPPRKPWDNDENNLPEWAMENPSESGGSFDASGAFHGGSAYSDEEDNLTNHSNQRRTEPPKPSSSQPRPGPHSKKEPPNITNGTTASHQDTSGNDSHKVSGSVPLRQSQSATSLSTERRPTNHPITSSASFSGVNSHMSHTSSESKPQREERPVKSSLSSAHHSPTDNQRHDKPAEDNSEQKQSEKTIAEEDIQQRLLDVFVSRLMDEEEKEPPPAPPTTASPSTPAPTHAHPMSDTLWYYQDPQGNVQGPFQSSEMTEWFNSGYFKGTLLVRRACDERYSPLSDLIKLWKGVPFMLDYYLIPPIKNTEQPMLPTLPVLDENIYIQLQLQQRVMQQRQALAKLSQTEHFNNLTLDQQHQMLAHQAQIEMNLQTGLMTPHTHSPAHTNTNVMAMLHQLAQYQQLHQQQARPGAQVPVSPPAEAPPDPVQQLMQHMGLLAHSRPSTTSQSVPEDQRSIEQFMNAFRQQQNTVQPQPPPQSQPVAMESVWGGTATAPVFPSWSSAPPGPPPTPQSLWPNPVAKGIKTEQEILEEQLRAEEKKKEELRKQEELQRLKEEEDERQRRIKEEEELERKRKEEEERERERERKRIQEEEERKKKEAAAAKKAEQDRLRKEEEKKRKEEEKRRKEEEKRKQEEERKKAEEEKKRLEEERKKREEMAKRQNEALKRLQEQQQARAVKPASAPAPWTAPDTAAASLADIQKTERKQQQQLREQQEMLKAYQERHQQEQQQQQLKSSKSGTSLNLKWAESAKNQPARVKSLAEIQAEEHERMAKQAEKEKAERMAATKEVSIAATGSIWASANQSLSWNSQSTASVWGTTNSVSASGARYWEEVSAKPNKPSKPAAQQQPAAKTQPKTKAKKEEASVMKLFEKQIPKRSKTDEFNKWCTKTLSSYSNNVDIPTFVDFLLAFESQKEIREYARMYLGENKEANDFATEFIERRARLLSSDQTTHRPEPVSNPTNHFQEVKGKNKKVKKNKMTKVDSRILGFNVTAAPDRINVGDRDYGEGL